MRLGEFARRCNVTKDTIRYYVNVGLLIPKTEGTQSNFTEREFQELQYIQKLKDMQFNIKEIKAFLALRRLSNMIEPDTIEKYSSMLSEKRESLTEGIEQFKRSIEEIDAELKKVRSGIRIQRTVSGVPLETVQYLACPFCQQQLKISGAEISGQSISSGVLECGCGYRAEIKEGILATGNIYTGGHDSPQLDRKSLWNVNEEWETCVQKCSDLVNGRIEGRDWANKVILESNINGIFYLYNNICHLPVDCCYILIDKYEETLRMYKNLIEALAPELKILYIADATMDYPLREKCVDLYISFFGENEHSLYHKNLYVEDGGRYLKDTVEVVGAIQSFPANSVSRKNCIAKYPEGSSRMLNSRFMKESYEKAGFAIEMTELGSVSVTNKHHIYECHVDGEQLSVSYFRAWKRQS